MRSSIWLAAGLIVAGGCASAHEPVRRPVPDVGASAAQPVETHPASGDAQPGCQLSHQPFPAFGEGSVPDELPEAVTKVPPAVPSGQNIEGTVLVTGLVCEHGRVVQTRIMKSIPGLDEAASEAMMRWTFKPALSGGKPIAVWVTSPIRFGPN
jgi:TonB family protein